MVTRRSLVAGGLASIALPAFARTGRHDAQLVRALYRRSVIINGNLAGGYYEHGRLSREIADKFRATGLTAFKLSLGGDSEDRASTGMQIDQLDAAIAANPELFVRVRKPSDMLAAKRSGLIGIIASFESANMLEGNVDTIDAFRARDVLVMGLSYNLQTPFGSGMLVGQSTGLTPLGRQAVARMNEVGVTLDISHSDELTGAMAISASQRPVLVTHAGCAAVHSHPRNKSDALIRSLADRGGVIGMYELAFLTDGSHQQSLADYMAHMVHALNVAGEDHVAIGSDASPTGFDVSREHMEAWYADIARRKKIGVGAPGEGPPPFVVELNRPDRIELIAESLAKRGYGSSVLAKIVGANFNRVFGATWI